VTDTLEQQVVDIIAKKKKLDPSAVTASSTFDELGLDSLDAADVMFTVEDTFAVVVPDEAATTMKTVGDVVAGLRQLIAGRPGAS
jgi:acyl carrier protein